MCEFRVKLIRATNNATTWNEKCSKRICRVENIAKPFIQSLRSFKPMNSTKTRNQNKTKAMLQSSQCKRNGFHCSDGTRANLQLNNLYTTSYIISDKIYYILCSIQPHRTALCGYSAADARAAIAIHSAWCS